MTTRRGAGGEIGDVPDVADNAGAMMPSRWPSYGTSVNSWRVCRPRRPVIRRSTAAAAGDQAGGAVADQDHLGRRCTVGPPRASSSAGRRAPTGRGAGGRSRGPTRPSCGRGEADLVLGPGELPRRSEVQRDEPPAGAADLLGQGPAAAFSAPSRSIRMRAGRRGVLPGLDAGRQVESGFGLEVNQPDADRPRWPRRSVRRRGRGESTEDGLDQDGFGGTRSPHPPLARIRRSGPALEQLPPPVGREAGDRRPSRRGGCRPG